jgi:hypothetical protein
MKLKLHASKIFLSIEKSVKFVRQSTIFIMFEIVVCILTFFGFTYLLVGNSNIEVLDLTPVLVNDVGSDVMNSGLPTKGVSFILHIRNNSWWRVARIRSASVEGRLNEPGCYQIPSGTYLGDPKIDIEQKKWFQNISSTSDYFNNDSFPIIEPKSEVWLKLNYLYPTVRNGGVIALDECCRDGFDSCQTRSSLTWRDFFKLSINDVYNEKGQLLIKAGSDLKLREEWKNNEIHFQVKTIPVIQISIFGQNQKNVKNEVIHFAKKASKQEWLDLSARELESRPDF